MNQSVGSGLRQVTEGHRVDLFNPTEMMIANLGAHAGSGSSDDGHKDTHKHSLVNLGISPEFLESITSVNGDNGLIQYAVANNWTEDTIKDIIIYKQKHGGFDDFPIGPEDSPEAVAAAVAWVNSEVKADRSNRGMKPDVTPEIEWETARQIQALQAQQAVSIEQEREIARGVQQGQTEIDPALHNQTTGKAAGIQASNTNQEEEADRMIAAQRQPINLFPENKRDGKQNGFTLKQDNSTLNEYTALTTMYNPAANTEWLVYNLQDEERKNASVNNAKDSGKTNEPTNSPAPVVENSKENVFAGLIGNMPKLELAYADFGSTGAALAKGVVSGGVVPDARSAEKKQQDVLPRDGSNPNA